MAVIEYYKNPMMCTYPVEEISDSHLSNAITYWEGQVNTAYKRLQYSRNTLPQLYEERKKRAAQPKVFFEGV